MLDTLQAAARQALACADPADKIAALEDLAQRWRTGRLPLASAPDPVPLEVAGRPDRPALADPRSMPMRKLNGPAGHAALIHALTHIEFNAINLALDALYRFVGLPPAFYDDWLQVAEEEALHFGLLRTHLQGLGHDYGDFTAHDGLWQLAQRTGHDLLARMALVPRLMEARGLDVTPDIQQKLRGYGDAAGADILDIILRDEIGHVAAGDRWFRHVCAQRGLAVEPMFRALLAEYDAPRPRRPFNEAARLQAGFTAAELNTLDAAL